MLYDNNSNEFYDCLESYGLNPLDMWPQEETFVLLERPREIMNQDSLLALAFIRSIHQDVHHVGKSFLASWDGRHRSGKSMSSIVFSWLLDKTFKQDFEKRIIHNPNDFTEYIYQIDKRFTFNHTRGCAVVVDEAGNTMASHEWQSQWSININKVLQSMGYLRPIINFVAPVKDNVNSGVRKLVNFHFTVSRNNNEFSTIKPYQMQYNSLMGKTFPRFPRIHFFGERLILQKIRMRGIPSEIMERYQKLEIDRKQKMMADNLSGLREQEDVKEENMDREKLVNRVVDNYGFYQLKRGDKLDADLIKFDLGISPRFAKYIQRLAENKLIEMNKITAEIKEVKEMSQYKQQTSRNKEIFIDGVPPNEKPKNKRKVDDIYKATADQFDLQLDE